MIQVGCKRPILAHSLQVHLMTSSCPLLALSFVFDRASVKVAWIQTYLDVSCPHYFLTGIFTNVLALLSSSATLTVTMLASTSLTRLDIQGLHRGWGKLIILLLSSQLELLAPACSSGSSFSITFFVLSGLFLGNILRDTLVNTQNKQ